MNPRPLTPEEITAFKWRHPIFVLTPIPKQGEYIEDSTLGGFVLVFKKQDGTVTYTLVGSDPSKGDPNSTLYIVRETAKAVADNAAKVGSNLGSGLAVGFGTVGVITIIIIVVLVLDLGGIRTALLKTAKPI